jgi:uncharacterized membrane protein YbhN (UPF0104 family)
VTTDAPGHGPRRGRAPFGLLTRVLAVALVMMVIWRGRGLWGPTASALVAAHPAWLVTTALAQVASFAASIAAQRAILADAEARLSFTRVARSSLAGNAVSAAVPVVGPNLGFFYTMRSLMDSGVAGVTAAWSLVVAGVMSSVALAVLMTTGGLMQRSGVGRAGGIGAAFVGVLPMVALLAALRHRGFRRRVQCLLLRLSSRTFFGRPFPLRTRAEGLTDLLTRLGAIPVRRRTWAKGLSLSVLSWMFDLGCLAAALAAVGATVPWRSLPLAWALVCSASGFKYTPLGIGTMEAAAAFGLGVIGVGPAPALAAAILYRAAGTWLPAVVGWLWRPRPALRPTTMVVEESAPGPGRLDRFEHLRHPPMMAIRSASG